MLRVGVVLGLGVASTALTVLLLKYTDYLRCCKNTSKSNAKAGTSALSPQPCNWPIDQLIRRRRSIFPKNYDPNQQVPREILDKMLESANWAPTHGRTEPWRFIVFSTPQARERLGQFEADLYKQMTPPDKFLVMKYQKKLQNKRVASYVIAIVLKRQESGKIPEIEEVEAVACAVQNMHLTATAYGVGAYWSSGHVMYSEEMKAFLKLTGKQDKCLGLFYVGVPKGSHPRGVRGDIQDKVQWITE